MTTGADILAKCRTQIGDRYRLGAKVDKTAADPDEYDCSELPAWAVYQLTGKLYGCRGTDPKTADAYSGWWAALALDGHRYADRDPMQGGRIDLDIALRTRGAVLIRSPGGGVGGHVAVSDGEGGTVEAHSTPRGVCAVPNAGKRRWDVAYLVPGVQFTTIPEPAVLRSTILRYGSSGGDVKAIQRAVGVTPDGKFGRDTAAAVVAWQDAHGLVPDGEVGPATWTALFPDGS
jgi:hypothetical protein